MAKLLLRVNEVECPGCNSILDVDRIINPIPEIEEKVLPGEPMPLGECPECGELIPADEQGEGE